MIHSFDGCSPCPCTFVNMVDIVDEDRLACEDVATGMGILAMKNAYNEKKIAEVLPKFKDGLRAMDAEDTTCLLEKIRLYLEEYFGENLLKELDMAFVSIGQKCGFVSAGDVHRKEIADTKAETHAQDKKNAVSVLKDMGMSSEQIAEFQAKLEAKSAEK